MTPILGYEWILAGIILTIAAAAAIFSKILFSKKKLEIKNPRKLLIIAVVSYILIFSTLSILKHEAYNSTAFDLGIFDQTMWGYSHFDNIFNTVRGMVLLGDHADPILFFFAPIYWLPQRLDILLIAQTALIAAAAVPLFLLARKILKNDTAALFIAVAYLAYPSLHYVNLFDFHPAALAIFPFALAAYALAQKRYALMLIFTSFASMAKEYYALAFIALGAYIFLFQKKKFLGTMTGLLGIAWFAFNMKVLIPLFSSSYQHFTGFEYLKTGLLQAFTLGKLGYLALLAFPFGLGILLLLAPDMLLLASPFLAINLLRQTTGVSEIMYQHNCELIAFLFATAVIGMARASRLLKKENAAVAVAAALMLLSIGASISYGPFATIYNAHTFNVQNASDVKALADMIPENASVSASTWAVPHLSERKQIYMFPNPFYMYDYGQQYWTTTFKGEGTDYVLINTERADPLMNESFRKETIGYMTSNSGYEKISEKGGWMLLREK